MYFVYRKNIAAKLQKLCRIAVIIVSLLAFIIDYVVIQ